MAAVSTEYQSFVNTRPWSRVETVELLSLCLLYFLFFKRTLAVESVTKKENERRRGRGSKLQLKKEDKKRRRRKKKKERRKKVGN